MVLYGPPQEDEHIAIEGAEFSHVFEREELLAEFSNGKDRSIEREGRNDRIHAMTLFKTRIDHRGGLVNTSAEWADDAIDERVDFACVAKATRAAMQNAVCFIEERVRAVHHDLGDACIC